MRQYNAPPPPQSMWQDPLHFIAFGFGSGALPIAPGTFGTLIAIPFYLLIAPVSLKFYLIFITLITLASMWLCDRVSKETHTHDHQGMCIDEVVGFLMAMTGAPSSWIWIVFGFLLFRLFDIWKPWPISWMDTHIQGGVGMILDDVMAGIYSAIILHFSMSIFL